jgi:DNA-directed RNA polymerase specialized sigma24 family protein
MTTAIAPSLSPHLEAVRSALADPAVRQSIQSLVGRRVPAQEVGDVVQAIVCDALAADDPPPPGDVPRWLFGIARHKVADHHRQRSRRPLEVLDAALVEGRGAPLEARSLLRGLVADAARDPRSVQTLGWIAREAAGERLDELAREASLPPATVRQRVSRLRRWLRKRWRTEALLVLAAAITAVAVALHRPARSSIVPIAADPMGDPAAAAGAALQGRWRVVTIDPDGSLDAARRALVEADARTTVVEVRGDLLVFTSAYHHGERRLEAGAVTGGRFEVKVTDASGRVQRATGSFDERGRLVVGSPDGDWRGRAVLERAP